MCLRPIDRFPIHIPAEVGVLDVAEGVGVFLADVGLDAADGGGVGGLAGCFAGHFPCLISWSLEFRKCVFNIGKRQPVLGFGKAGHLNRLRTDNPFRTTPAVSGSPQVSPSLPVARGGSSQPCNAVRFRGRLRL